MTRARPIVSIVNYSFSSSGASVSSFFYDAIILICSIQSNCFSRAIGIIDCILGRAIGTTNCILDRGIGTTDCILDRAIGTTDCILGSVFLKECFTVWQIW